MIIATTGPNTLATRAVIDAVAQQLNLLSINITQPITNALACLLELDPHEIQRETDPNRHYKRWGKNQHEWEQSLCLLARTGNPQCFIDYAEQRLQNTERGITIKLFNGYLITGIGTELEANWLRKNGGTLVHLYDYTATYSYLDEHDTDHALVTTEANEQTLADFIARLESAGQQEAA